MATFEVIEVFGGRRAGGDLKDHTYSRKFFVKASSQATPVEVVAAPGIPIFGSAYTAPNGFVDSNSYAKTITATARDESPLFFDVEAEYSNVLDFAPGQGINPTGAVSPQPGAGNPLQAQDSPLLRPWVVRWGVQTITKHILEDADGAAIINKAGAPYEGGLEAEDGFLTLTVVRNELAASFDPVQMTLFVWRTNLNAWNGFAPERVLLASIETGDRAYDRGVYYFPVTYQFRFVTKVGRTWRRRVLNQGWYYLTVANDYTKRQDFTDDNTGRPLATQGLLKADGTKLNPLTESPVYLEFKIYDTIDFAGLNMG